MPSQITYVVDPLNILTMGMISGDPLNLITNGFVTAIIEEEIIEVVVGGGGGDFGTDVWNPWDTKKETKKKKKITARVFIDGNEYKETVFVDNLTLNIKNVKLDIRKNLDEVIIKIILPE